MNNNLSSETTGAAPDYSKAECWYKIPEITKEVDTFYINNIKDNAAKRVTAYLNNRT